MLCAATHSPSLYHPLPTVTTYQPQAKVAIARAYRLRLRNGFKAPLVYFKLQPSRQFISARIKNTGRMNDVNNERAPAEPAQPCR